MTLIELKTKVLQELRVLAAGENPNPDDAQIIGDKYLMLYDMLIAKSMVTWAAGDDIPDFACVPIIKMVAYLSALSFGVQGPEYALLQSEGALDLPSTSLAERMLRKQLAKSYVSQPAQPDYF